MDKLTFKSAARLIGGTFAAAAVVVTLATATQPASAQAAPTAKPASVPTPAATATPAMCSVPKNAALTVRWHPDSQDPATGCGSGDAAVRSLPTPGVRYGAKDNVVPKKASIAEDLSAGITITFEAERPAGAGSFQGFGKKTGVRFRPDPGKTEDRFAVLIRPDAREWPGAQPFVLYVNPSKTCNVDAQGLRTEHRIGCSPEYDDGSDKTKSDPKVPADCKSTSTTFCGYGVIAWKTFGVLVPPGTLRGATTKPVRNLEICTMFTDHEVDPNTANPQREGFTCRTLSVENEPGLDDAGQRRLSYNSAAGNPASSPAPSAQTTTSSLRRSTAAAATPAPAAGSSGPNSGTLYNSTAVLPLSNTARASIALGHVDVSSLLGRLQQNYAAASKGLAGNLPQLIPEKGSLGCASSTCPDDSFTTLDAAFFEAVRSPFLADADSMFARTQIDLKPVDFTKVPTVNYGAKIVAAPPGSRLGLAWFRDIKDVETGSVLHAEHDFGIASLGVTHVVANIDPAHDPNVYRTDIGHTANTVFGLTAPLTRDHSLQFYARQGIVSPSGAHDTLGVFNYTPSDGGHVVDATGTQQRFFGSAGYRTVDAGYDPLGTAYDSFVGTRSLFATAGFARYRGSEAADDPAGSLTVTGVRAWDGTQPRYSALMVAAVAKAGRGENAFSLSASRTRSDVAASIVARDGATVKITNVLGSRLERNDASSVSLGFGALRFVFSAGLTWAAAPTSCTANADPACPSNYARTANYSVKRSDSIFLDLSANLAPKQQAAFDQKSVPVNQFETKGVLAFRDWCTPGPRYEPILTYDSNISQDGSSYLPGHLIEARLDIGGANARHVVRVSYRLVLDQSGSPVSQSQHGLYVGIATDNISEAFRTRCPAVLKDRAARKQAAAAS